MRATLKTGTRQIHEKVDDAFSTLDLADYHDYSVFLNAHFHAYSALARCRQDHPTLCDALNDLKNLIFKDLRILGTLHDSPAAPHSAPALHPLGIGYVIGGSHFGKRVLQKRWSKSTDPRVLKAGHYLDTHLLKQVWGVMLVELNTGHKSGDTQRAIIRSATATFDLFLTSFLNAKAASTLRLEPA